MTRRVPSRVFLFLILITVAVVALPQLPRPWLTRDDSVSILDITCDIQRQESSYYEQGTEVQLQLKFQASGSMENVTLATASSEGRKVTKGSDILDSIASVELSTFKSDGQAGFALTGLHLVTPFSGQLAGTYFLDVHRINETDGSQVVFSYRFDNIDCFAGEKRERTNSVFKVQCVPSHKLNITWVPPPNSEPTTVNVDLVLSGMPPFLSRPVNVYKINQTNHPSTQEVLLAERLKPRCGATNYTIIMFVSPHPLCILSCIYECQVWYPECEEGGMGKYCKCGAPTPDDREKAIAQNTLSTDCDNSTETETTKRSIPATTSKQPPARSTTTPSSTIIELNTVSNKTHSLQTSPSDTVEIAPSKKSVDNSGPCFLHRTHCAPFRAVAVIVSAITGLVLLIALIMVRRRLNSRRP